MSGVGERLRTYALAAASVLGCSISSASADAPRAGAASFDAARAAIESYRQEQSVPGLAVAVWRDGEILWEQGFGWADMENRVPATPHTMFALASLSKTLTATGLMTLVQSGKIQLERPINDYLGPDRLTVHAGDPRAVTVERLTNHTSGLVASSQFFYGAEAAGAPSMSETIRRYGIVVDPAGERYRYSNIGYGVLGELIARVSGKSYADFMRQTVFLPLGMTHSSVYLAPGLERYQAIRYDFDRRPIPDYVSAEPASAMVYSSVHDLARFGMFFLKNRLPDQREILSPASIDRMIAKPIHEDAVPVRAPARDESGYAVGWAVYREGGHRAIGHSGSMSGVSTMFVLIPEQRLGVVVLANADGGSGSLHVELLKSLLDWHEAPSAAPAAPAAKAFQPPPALLGHWLGTLQTYEGPQPITLQVHSDGDVHVLIGDEPRFNSRSSMRQTALLNDVRFERGQLSGHSLAQIETSDTSRRPHTLSLELRLRDGVLAGTATAESVYQGLWTQTLPYWVELRRADKTAARL